MKNILLILIIIFLGCSNNSEEPIINNIPDELIGKWKLTEKFIHSGTPENIWVEVDTGLTYDIWFKENGEVMTPEKPIDCQTGTYSVSLDSIINFNFPCFGESVIPIDSLTNTLLITDVTYIEYELNKYQKVIE